MKSLTEKPTRKAPPVIRDKSLDKPDEVILFPEKVKKAKETIARIGLPKEKH